MLTLDLLNAVTAFGRDMQLLHKLDAVDHVGSLQHVQFVVCQVAAKALDIGLAVALLFPTEMGRHISGRVLAEKHAILDTAQWLNRDFYLARSRVPRNIQRTLKRLRAAQQVRLRSMPWFHCACLEGQSLILSGRDIPAADFDHRRDKALGCRLHALGRQERLGGYGRLGTGLAAPPIIEPASEGLKRAILEQAGGRIGAEGHFYAVKHPDRPTRCIGFAVLDADVAAPAWKAWVELSHIEIAMGYYRVNLGRTLLGWLKRKGQENGFRSIWVRRSKADATLDFWTKMRFTPVNDEWLVHGPLSCGAGS